MPRKTIKSFLKLSIDKKLERDRLGIRGSKASICEPIVRLEGRYREEEAWLYMTPNEAEWLGEQLIAVARKCRNTKGE